MALPPSAGAGWTLREVLARERAAAAENDAGPLPERQRFLDGLFLLGADGSQGEDIPGLRLRVGGRARRLDEAIGGRPDGGLVQVEIDRSQTGYTRNWPAFLARRWSLRAGAYSRWVEDTVERACGGEARAVLRRDTPDRVRRFLAAVAARIHAAPYETYSRYLEGGAPFKSCDQALDAILAGDGGNCAEKAMALFFAARAHGIPAEVVLGGEEAAGAFPVRELRSILDRRTFHDPGGRQAQHYWQHYAFIGRLPGEDGEEVFCDVAGSNIPFLFLSGGEAAAYLDPGRRRPLPVTITLEPLRLFFHRLADRQDIPLDLYYAMEHFVESIDVIQTVDNELGLVHTGDFWVGVASCRGRRELGRVVAGYRQFVRRAGRDPGTALGLAPEWAAAAHPLFGRFFAAHPRAAGRVRAADAGLRRRVGAAARGLDLSYVIIDLTPPRAPVGVGGRSGR